MGKGTISKIYPPGKIDIHQKSDRLQLALRKIAEDDSNHPENRQLLADFVRDCRIGKTVHGRSKKKIGDATCLKHLFALRLTCAFFKKPLKAVTTVDMERFVEALDDGGIVSTKGAHYAADTKSGIKKTVRKFWKWLAGGNKVYPETVEWIETHCAIKEVSALTRDEIEQMIDQTASVRDKALLMVLFDSGARVEELLNVRLKPEHLFWKEETGCYMVRLEYSKTKPRTISLPLSTRLLKAWLENHPAKGNPQAQVFPLTYGNLRMLIHRIGRRVLKKRVTPHMLRHSSATFYANKLKNRYKLCYRYGWAMSSDMVDRYLDREGLMEEETASVVKGDELALASRQSQSLKEELALLKESYSELLESQDKLRQELEVAQNATGHGGLLMDIVKEQRQMAEVLEQISGRRFGAVLTPISRGKATIDVSIRKMRGKKCVDSACTATCL